MCTETLSKSWQTTAIMVGLLLFGCRRWRISFGSVFGHDCSREITRKSGSRNGKFRKRTSLYIKYMVYRYIGSVNYKWKCNYRRLTCGPHLVAGHGCDDVVGLLLIEFGRGREIMWQGSRILQAASTVTSLVHG